MNRLYWLGRNGLWKWVFESYDERVLNQHVSYKMGASLPVGIHGYSRIQLANGDVFWYVHKKDKGSFTRSIVADELVPKPIQLLEMLL